jgi:hypothetical protein
MHNDLEAWLDQVWKDKDRLISPRRRRSSRSRSSIAGFSIARPTAAASRSSSTTSATLVAPRPLDHVGERPSL